MITVQLIDGLWFCEGTPFDSFMAAFNRAKYLARWYREI